MADNFNTRLYARGYNASTSARAPSPPQPAVCAPACADCGLLECLCRPRFFAGQLLTEQDLNRLDAYIRAKNRMHNIQLHGWGVVNGLQVRCDSCGTGVIVGTGYAIDPCGEDIVVCGDTAVDICALIKRCQPTDVTCLPTATGTTCDDVEEDWVLAIRYAETQARSVTALRSTPSCACGATNCNGGGGCGCGNKMTTSTAPTNAMTSTSTQKPKNAPTECEATAICEGFGFDAFLAPTPVPRDTHNQLGGGIIDAIRCCIEPLRAQLPKAPGAFGKYSQTPQLKQAWNLWCCRMQRALAAFFSTGSQADCTLAASIQSYACPSPAAQNFDAEMQQSVQQIMTWLIDAAFACVCMALLPPAPCGTSDDRVPLAIVTVRKKDCKVLRVCNWTPLRRLVINWPTLQYWFGWVPFFRSLQDMIANFCCHDVTLATRATRVPGDNLAAGVETGGSVVPDPQLDPDNAADDQTMVNLINDAINRGDAPVDAAAMVRAAFGVGPESPQPLSATEKANVGPFLLINEIVRPLIASLASSTPSSPSTGDTATSDLQLRVSKLEKAIIAMGGSLP